MARRLRCPAPREDEARSHETGRPTLDILIGLSLGFSVLALASLALVVRALSRRRWVSAALRAAAGALFASIAALAATLGISTRGYRSLTGEEVALTITSVPTGPHGFQAYVEFPDGRDTTFAVRGDQVLVDAHILKWRYVGNLLGLRTQYELDRLTGRYRDIDDERTLERTVHSLGVEQPVDLYRLLQRYSLLGLLVDAEYGSATYMDVDRPARLRVSVSTTGLLVREVPLG